MKSLFAKPKVSRKRQLDGSRFVECSFCKEQVLIYRINEHLDQDCPDVNHCSLEECLASPPSEKKQRSLEVVSSEELTGNSWFSFFNWVSTDLGTPKEETTSDSSKRERQTGNCAAACSESFRMNERDSKAVNNGLKPLAETVRPARLSDFYGQEELVDLIKHFLRCSNLPSMILWGPPGSGKTTLANIIQRSQCSANFVALSATTTSIKTVKSIVEQAKERQRNFKQKTILFVDEIHRFNKLQQDIFLPCVETGIITLIAATTENPSFECNSALLSRCKVFVLKKLREVDIWKILNRALQLRFGKNALGNDKLQQLLQKISRASDGDARAALNSLEMLHSRISNDDDDDDDDDANNLTENLLQRSSFLYDKSGEQHYDLISALHKSLRGSHVDASLYWLTRMLDSGEDPKYIARRLIRFAAEDVGVADPQALQMAVAGFQSVTFVGMPECDVCLAEVVVYLATAPKSVSVYQALQNVRKCIKTAPNLPPPLHLRNAPTKLMKQLGYGKGYKYNPSFNGPVEQSYLPDSIAHEKFYQ